MGADPTSGTTDSLFGIRESIRLRVHAAAISGSSDANGYTLLESHDFGRGSGFRPWAIASPNHRSELESARDSAQDPSRAPA